MTSMPAPSSAVITDRSVDGLIVAPIRRGPWAALRSLRAAMAELRRRHQSPRVSWVLAIDDRGRIVPGRAADAAVFVLAYRLPAAA
jgi:hypothetical protein